MHRTKKTLTNDPLKTRGRFIIISIYLIFVIILARLFFWQVIKADSLTKQAENQYYRSVTLTGNRGNIYTSDGYLLATNQRVYTLFAQPQLLKDSPENIAKLLLPHLLNELDDYQQATNSAEKEEIEIALEKSLETKLAKKVKWVSLKNNLSKESKQAVQNLNIFGLGFDPHLKRYYPEASMSAHITGFVGKDEDGNDLGYFGIEGALEKELKARKTQNTFTTDALGLQLLDSKHSSLNTTVIDGRDVTTTIKRNVQYLIEQELKKAVKKYGAKSGEVVVMDPKTGYILGLAGYPSYNQAHFYQYPTEVYKNPTLSNLYEPGSTFKAITVSAGIEEGVITPETKCDNCNGPRQFGKYTIKTWNNQYHPDITMEQGLAQSDNIAMIFIAERLGITKFKEYFHKFGVGKKINIDLQEDKNTPFPQQWGEVKLATTSFGQGVMVNSLQVLRAIATIANNGVMMRPTIIKSVKDPNTNKTIENKPIEERRVISVKTAQTVTKMLITSAQHGEAQWTASHQYLTAGKTGTSQVVTEHGYDNEKTIVSFVGFTPPENPKFVMITKLTEPTTSPWSAETTAPMWYKIADKLRLLL